MKNRITKFLLMLLTVIAVGSGATMLNLSLQEKKGPPLVRYDRQEQHVLTAETNAAPERKEYDDGVMYDLMPAEEVEVDAFADDLMSDLPEETESVPQERMDELALGARPEAFLVTEEKSREDTLGKDAEESASEKLLGNILPTAEEKQAYYYRLSDMEKVYASCMNTARKETLAVQQSEMESLLKIWDDELNMIYQKLRAVLPTKEFEELRDEERAWIRNRDEAATKAAARESYSNSAQNLAHTHSLLEWTKERVYQLAEMYYGRE